MQSLETGQLHPLRDLTQESKDATGVPRRYQGPTFTVGEVVDVKGGKFRVQSFGKRGRIVLRGVPA